MKKLLLLLTCCLGLHAHGQNYKPFLTQDTAYFSENTTKELFPLIIDSAKADGTDTVFYLYKQIRAVNLPDCPFTSLGDSWLGRYVAVYRNGDVGFRNKSGSPIYVKTHASLGETIQAYLGTRIRATLTLTSWNTESFLGLTDSVKTFRFNIFRADGQDTLHPYDGMELKLSKHHGWIKLVNFYLWDQPQDGFESGTFNLDLVGLHKRGLGRTNLRGKQFFEFAVGDVFHIEERESGGYTTTYTTTLQWTVLAKSTTATRVIYHIRQQSKREKREGSTLFDPVFGLDTLVRSYAFDTLYQAHGQLVGHTSTPSFAEHRSKREGKRIPNAMYIRTDSTCYHLYVLSGCHIDQEYYAGLGGPYHENCSMPMFNTSRRLLYYKKGREEWGTPLSFQPDAYLATQVSIHPNPAKDLVHFSFGTLAGEVLVELRDMTGNVVLSKRAVGSCELSLSPFPKGLYFYTVTQAARQASGKLVVE